MTVNKCQPGCAPVRPFTGAVQDSQWSPPVKFYYCCHGIERKDCEQCSRALPSPMTSTLDDARACENTDREIWRGPDEGGGDFYADSLHITRDGGLGINCGGSVYVKPIREWHRLAGGPISGLRKPDDARARDIVTEWLGMFDPPPQIDFQQSEFLQCAIASAIKAALVSPPSEAGREMVQGANADASPLSGHPGTWRPIETAPHETRVLLGWDQLGTWFCETGMASHGWRRNGVSNMSRHGFATHWMPLPASPLENNRTGAASAEEVIVHIKSSDQGTVAVASADRGTP